MKTKKTSIEWLINQFVLSSISYIGRFRAISNYKGSKPCILCYHSVDNGDWRFSTKIKDFRKQINYLNRTRKIISLSKMITKSVYRQKNYVSITFDDGYESVVKNVLPILAKHNITGTVFMLGSSKGVDREELDNNKRLLSIHQIKKLRNAGWEIGFHTNTHSYFRKLNERELREEIVEGKKELEQKLGFKLRYFAYPKGIYSEKIIKIVKEAGFKAAFTVDGGALKKSSDNYRIKRVVMDGNRNMQQYGAILSGAGLFYGQLRVSILKFQDYLKYKMRSQIVNL